MNKFFRLAVCLLAVALLSPGASAKKAKIAKLYDSKSWIVPVVGEAEQLNQYGVSSKIYKLDMLVPDLRDQGESWKSAADRFSEMGFGNQVLDFLTDNGTSEAKLREIALLNMQRQDEEFANETLRVGSGDDVANVIAEDYLPVLTHLYVCMRHKFTQEVKVKGGGTETRTFVDFALYKIMIDNEQAFDIMASIGNPEKYKALPKFKLELVYKFHNGDGENELINQVPDLALRGVVTRRHPAQISIGANAGLKKGDLVSVFSQRMDKKGNPYSKRISRARVCKVWDDQAQVNFEAGLAGNRKNGDVVVRTPDKHTRLALMATYSPHVWGGELLMDVKTGYMRSGIIHHFLMPLSFSMTDHPGDKFMLVDDPYHEYKAPMFLDLGIGYGLSKTFLGFMDFMPYFTVNYEAALMMKTDLLNETAAPTSDHMPFGSFIRIPVGLRFSFNIGYPLRFAVEAGYAFNFGVGGDHKIIEQTCDYMSAKRKGFFAKVGLIF